MNQTKAYAAQTPDTDLAPWTFEPREVGPHDVQIEILFCGVCHTDLHQIKNEWFPGMFPMVPGHEIVGRVAQVGAHVKNFAVGDLAGVGCLIDSCQHCVPCQEGEEHFCVEGATQTYNNPNRSGNPTYGGYASAIVVREEFVLHVSDKLDLAGVAPLLCAGITTYSPLRHWKVGHGHKLAVVGLGGLGHMAVKFGVAFGADVTVLSTSSAKEQDAKDLGAHHFVVTKDEAQLAAVRGSFDFILDTVAADHDIPLYLSLLKINGTHILLGVPPKPLEIPAFSLIVGRKSIAGSMIGGIAETQEMLNFCAEHNIVSDVEVIDIKDITHAFERMVKGDVRYRFAIDMATL
ncbi:NAD(P)-dependent alcohol dehydrogenase [Hymenobacter sp. GOD-10R]|uniref:NAD(P)-dependent alcohol dehydrogenase n=1 Tax=Hymenobacter sp. GOD-10R TaxID=3093922 RepID=UPI002D78192F|nr:NAD(P)-dependent alcohol dehydrogenase [Hymenobacter sp. GOD-10R]WRQ31084.1 NAD(P)-dependent alcohol dehydrogenase [Hymenobacter sp. GOD-10R]